LPSFGLNDQSDIDPGDLGDPKDLGDSASDMSVNLEESTQ